MLGGDAQSMAHGFSIETAGRAGARQAYDRDDQAQPSANSSKARRRVGWGRRRAALPSGARRWDGKGAEDVAS